MGVQGRRLPKLVTTDSQPSSWGPDTETTWVNEVHWGWYLRPERLPFLLKRRAGRDRGTHRNGPLTVTKVWIQNGSWTYTPVDTLQFDTMKLKVVRPFTTVIESTNPVLFAPTLTSTTEVNWVREPTLRWTFGWVVERLMSVTWPGPLRFRSDRSNDLSDTFHERGRVGRSTPTVTEQCVSGPQTDVSLRQESRTREGGPPT